MKKLNISKEIMYDLYINQDLSYAEISKKLSIGLASVSRLCNKFGIYKEVIHPKNRVYTKPFSNNLYAKIDKNTLYSLYIEKNMTVDEISKLLKLSKCVIKKALRYNKITKSKEKAIEVRSKAIFEKYGVAHYSKTREFKEKLKQTNLKNCGYESNLQSPTFIKTVKDMFKLKYGVYNSFQIPEVREKAKNTIKERYNVENIIDSPIIKNKIKNTMKEKYGVDHYSKTREFKEKLKQTNLKNCGYESNFKTIKFKNEAKQTCLRKYGVDHAMKLEATKLKVITTKKKNGTSCTSKFEEMINNLLLNKFSEVIRQYHSEKYPFACDFYIPEKDLYIEYQGHFSHGKEPFDSENINHQNIIKLWKSKNKNTYDHAIYIWTIRDPLKRKTAKDNNLNWLEFFNITDFERWYNEN